MGALWPFSTLVELVVELPGLKCYRLKLLGASECSHEKQLSGETYVLVGTCDTSMYGCKTDCVYEAKGKPGKKFCFKSKGLPGKSVQEFGNIITLIIFVTFLLCIFLSF